MVRELAGRLEAAKARSCTTCHPLPPPPASLAPRSDDAVATSLALASARAELAAAHEAHANDLAAVCHAAGVVKASQGELAGVIEAMARENAALQAANVALRQENERLEGQVEDLLSARGEANAELDTPIVVANTPGDTPVAGWAVRPSPGMGGGRGGVAVGSLWSTSPLSRWAGEDEG